MAFPSQPPGSGHAQDLLFFPWRRRIAEVISPSLSLYVVIPSVGLEKSENYSSLQPEDDVTELCIGGINSQADRKRSIFEAQGAGKARTVVPDLMINSGDAICR
ncbi:hypothetical protein HPP92_016578 [Vanilla planifolia]|uniref:Uncharacterized protein n=1 Tax=Vanilla planifolia TaxID=51239 RepID=A0A835QJK5_VANPL|nr:hypothetical protein HPP92_016578 [Vanilla planifolia]